MAEEVCTPIEFLTADVTPVDRLAAIMRVKERVRRKESCLVVSTQCVEAGVDLDMDMVVRDFAPLDSLVQVAGRCNRNGERSRGDVEVVRLLDDESGTNRQLARYVYDCVLLDATDDVLAKLVEVPEDQVFGLTRRYFDWLAVRKNTGEAVLEAWAYWRELPDSVRRLLRGAERPKHTFLVIEQDPGLRTELNRVRAISERWERRREMRRLAGRIARLCVSVYQRGDLDPSDHADPFPPDVTGNDVWFWMLKAGRYRPETGLDLSDPHDADAWGVIL